MPRNNSRNTDGWLAFFDIYGFGSEIAQRRNSALARRLDNFHEVLADLAASKSIIFYMFSDSVVLFAEDKKFTETPEKGLPAIIDTIRTAQLRGLEQSFMLRGAVCHGKMQLSDVGFTGDPLLKAARLEPNLALPLIVLLEEDLHPNSKNAPSHRRISNFPTKTGIRSGHVILPSPLEPMLRHAIQRRDRHLREGPDEIARIWKSFVDFLNTLPKPL
jgi:hypothetical protein